MRQIAEILSLPVPDRIELVEAIWDSIVEVPEAVPVSEELRKELDRRLDAYYRNPEGVRPWDAVRKELFPSE
jgi:putative addiction module component (TIGR02574 family)